MYDQRQEPNEFVADSVAEATGQAAEFFGVDAGELKVVVAPDGEIFGTGGRSVIVAVPKEIAARGLALGDFDNDGAVDVLVTINDGPPILLRNNVARQNHWLGVRLVGRKANVDAIGAKITYRSGDFQRHRSLLGYGGFLCAHDPRIVLGLGKRTQVDWIEVKWPPPGDKVERFVNPPIDRYITIVEGEGKWV